MVTPRDERGSALIWVLGFIVTLGIVISASQVLARMAERQMYARNSVSRAELAAASAVEVLSDRVRGTVASKLGNLSGPDLLAINVRVAVLPHELETTGATVQSDTLLTGVRIVDVRDGEVIPHDEKILGVWTHQPRVGFEAIPDVGGSVAARTIELEVYATAYGPREGRRMVTRRLAVSVLSPYQHAVYTAGNAEIIGRGTGRLLGGLVGGPVRVDGTASFGAGAYLMTYVGGIEARDGISVSGGTHVLGGTTYTAGTPALANLTRAGAESEPQAMLAAWQGRVRIRPSVGGALSPGKMQTATIAGSGECLDFEVACAGQGSFRPAITLRRVTSGRGTEYSVTCGEAYHDDGAYHCGPAAGAPGIRYRPWPFTTPPAAGKAARDPSDPTRIWRGFFPDFRREAPCDASAIVGKPYTTFRCPTNAFGFEVVGDSLPAITGGMIAVKRATSSAPGAQEIVLIRKASRLAGPLTIVSEVPVVIWGSFNVNDPKPAMISAPRITVMPNETEAHLATSMAWDLVPAESGGGVYPAVAVQAQSNVTLYAVLRSGYCRTIGTAYFGGSWEGMPAVYGDWQRAALRVDGAVEGYDQTSAGAAACASFWAPPDGPQPGGDVVLARPFQRSILFNRRLLYPAGQPPGSWQWDNFDYLNTPAPGAPSRTRGRQVNAFGGVTVLRQIQDLRTIPPAERGTPLRPTRRTTPPPFALPGVPPAL